VSHDLHPAVRDVAASGAVSAGAGVVVLVVGSPAAALLGAVIALFVVAVVTGLRMPRAAREILLELRAAPEAPVDEGLSRAVWWSVAIGAAGLAVAVLAPGAIAICGGVLLGMGVSELGEAHWLRRWERLNDMRLLYRADYRWAGTNGRALGRGWFDPANFVASD
jgi:hypothetical protein